MSDVIDSYSFSKYLLTAKIGHICLFVPQVKQCSVSEPKDFILINSVSIRKWYSYFAKFVFESSTKILDLVIVDIDNECEYLFSILETAKLKIEKKGNLNCTFYFSKKQICDMLVGLSHLYITSLALPDVYQYAFTLIIKYFETLDSVNNWENTVNVIKNFSFNEFNELYENICKENNFKISSLNVYCVLHKYQNDFVVLYKMRMSLKIFNL